MRPQDWPGRTYPATGANDPRPPAPMPRPTSPTDRNALLIAGGIRVGARLERERIIAIAARVLPVADVDALRAEVERT